MTSHSITLTNLNSNTTYYYRVSSADTYGNNTTDNNSGNFYGFTTPGGNNFIPPTNNVGPNQDILSIDSNKIVLNNGNPFTNENQISIKLNDFDNTLKVKIGDDKNLIQTNWQNFNTDFLKQISSGDGTKSIYFQFRDSNGKASQIIEKTIVLDTQAPSAPSNFKGEYLINLIQLSLVRPRDSDVLGIRVFKSDQEFILDPYSLNEIISDGKAENSSDFNVKAGKTYYYSAFAYDYARNFSTPALIKISIPPYTAEPVALVKKGVKSFEFDLLSQTLKIGIGEKIEDLIISKKTFHFFNKAPLNIAIKDNNLFENVQAMTLVLNNGSVYGLIKQNELWVARIDLPQESMSLLTLEVLYKDGSKEIVELGQVLIDPFGYVYQKITEPYLKLFKNGLWSWERKYTQNKIEKVKVFLYQYNPDRKDWQLFEASRFGQQNPQITTKTGEYGFLVPAGQYYLEAIKIGFGEKTTEKFEVKDMIVNENVELSSIEINWWFIDENRNLVLLTVLPLGLLFAIISIKAIRIRRRRKIGNPYDGFSVK